MAVVAVAQGTAISAAMDMTEGIIARFRTVCLHPPNTQGRARATRHAPTAKPARPTSEVLAQETMQQMLSTTRELSR